MSAVWSSNFVRPIATRHVSKPLPLLSRPNPNVSVYAPSLVRFVHAAFPLLCRFCVFVPKILDWEIKFQTKFHFIFFKKCRTYFNMLKTGFKKMLFTYNQVFYFIFFIIVRDLHFSNQIVILWYYRGFRAFCPLLYSLASTATFFEEREGGFFESLERERYGFEGFVFATSISFLWFGKRSQFPLIVFVFDSEIIQVSKLGFWSLELGFNRNLSSFFLWFLVNLGFITEVIDGGEQELWDSVELLGVGGELWGFDDDPHCF